MRAIIGKKLGMTRIFDEQGNAVPTTLIWAKPNVVTQIKSKDKDGYEATQIADIDNKKIKKPQAGHLKEIKSRNLKEFKLDTGLKCGDKIDLSQFEIGEKINVTAVSKGKGFAGTVKRHHFHLGPKTHGGHNYRQPGSIGSAYPQRVIKGRKMPGHLGNEKVTTKNLKIVAIDLEKNIIMLSGAVPGINKSSVYLWSKS